MKDDPTLQLALLILLGMVDEEQRASVIASCSDLATRDFLVKEVARPVEAVAVAAETACKKETLWRSTRGGW